MQSLVEHEFWMFTLTVYITDLICEELNIVMIWCDISDTVHGHLEENAIAHCALSFGCDCPDASVSWEHPLQESEELHCMMHVKPRHKPTSATLTRLRSRRFGPPAEEQTLRKPINVRWWWNKIHLAISITSLQCSSAIWLPPYTQMKVKGLQRLSL